MGAAHRSDIIFSVAYSILSARRCPFGSAGRGGVAENFDNHFAAG